MKKLIYLFVAGSLILSSCSKEDSKENPTPSPNPTPVANPKVAVEKTNTAFLQKFSGTRCPPCGTWGWTMADELMASSGSKALYLGTFPTSNVAEGFITPEANEMSTTWRITGYPTFSVNGVLQLDRSSQGVNTASEKAKCNAAVEAHKAAAVVANTGVKYDITSDNKIKITASVKFFEKVEGEYNVAFYVVENNAKYTQSGKTGVVDHHYVLRGSANGTWGQNVVTSGAEANSFKDLTAEVAYNTSWVKENMDVYAVIWKKDGTSWKFVNASHVKK